MRHALAVFTVPALIVFWNFLMGFLEWEKRK